jgi:hypothetical protein
MRAMPVAATARMASKTAANKRWPIEKRTIVVAREKSPV